MEELLYGIWKMSKTCWNYKLIFVVKCLKLIVSCSIIPCKLIWLWVIEVISNHYNQGLKVSDISPLNVYKLYLDINVNVFSFSIFWLFFFPCNDSVGKRYITNNIYSDNKIEVFIFRRLKCQYQKKRKKEDDLNVVPFLYTWHFFHSVLRFPVVKI